MYVWNEYRKIARPRHLHKHVQEATSGNLTSDKHKSRSRLYVTRAKAWVEETSRTVCCLAGSRKQKWLLYSSTGRWTMFIKLHEVKVDQNCVYIIEEVFCFVKYRLVLSSHNARSCGNCALTSPTSPMYFVLKLKTRCISVCWTCM